MKKGKKNEKQEENKNLDEKEEKKEKKNWKQKLEEEEKEAVLKAALPTKNIKFIRCRHILLSSEEQANELFQ